MVVATEPNKVITAIVPARDIAGNGSGYNGNKQPVLEIKQKTSSRHEKRTHRDYYRHSGDDKNAPIEYVYTHTEETPKEETGQTSVNGLKNGQTSSELVPINGNGANKVECSVGEDGNLIVKIRGKPGSVSLDPSNLPVQLPEGWQLKEIRTNQRSRKTERSRKTRIKDEQIENMEDSVVVYNQQQDSAMVSNSNQEDESQSHFGNADEQEYLQGEENGVAFVEKRFRKFEKGTAGTTSKVEHIRSEESADAGNTDRKDRFSRNTTSVLEQSESASRKFSKQSVMDEKVTETHKSDVMYFDGDDGTSGPVYAQSSHQEDLNQQTRIDRRNQNRESIIIESPEDTPYNSLKRNQHHSEDTEIINIEDRYRYNNPPYNSQNDRYSQEQDTRILLEKNYGNGYPNSSSDRQNLGPSSNNNNNSLVENIDRTNIEDRYRYNYPAGSPSGNNQKERFEEQIRREEEIRKYQNGNNYPDSHSHVHENVDRTTVEDRFRYRTPSEPASTTETREEVRRREELRKYQNYPDSQNRVHENVEKNTVEDRFRYHEPKAPESTTETREEIERREELRRFENYPHNQNQVKEDIEKTTVVDHFRYQQPRGPTSTTETREEVQKREELQRYENIPNAANQTTEKVEKTTVEDRFRYQQPVDSTETREETRREEEIRRYQNLPKQENLYENFPRKDETRTETREETVLSSGKNFKCSYPPQTETTTEKTVKTELEERYRNENKFPTYVRDEILPTYSENTEKTNIDEYYRIHQQANQSALPTQPRPYSTSNPSQPTFQSDSVSDDYRKSHNQVKTMVGTEIRVDGNTGGKSPSPPQERRERKDRVTIDDRYRVVGRSGPVVHRNQNEDLREKTEEMTDYERTTIRNDQRTQSRLTDSSSTGERIIPIGVTSSNPQQPIDSRHSSRLSSVDLSEIKPGEHLDNTILKDRSNLSQVGSLGQRRPPTRNPAKYQFAEEEVMSTSTLPHFETAYRDRPVSVQVTSYNDGDSSVFKRSQTSSVKHQQTVRDERLLLNYVDNDSKPDWVHNIDQHFSGRGTARVQYNRENVTSPTPRIEEIVTIPGSTVIQVNGEHGEPVHGIVTEPGDRPLNILSQQPPVDRDLIHQRQQGSKYGFTRVTDSKGYKQEAKEKVQYQERRESVRQISVSYEIPGKGKETREYTWDGVRDQPEEKVTFHEERDHRKDVSVNLHLEQQIPTTTTETKVHQEKIVFDEIREPPPREVSVNLKLQTDRLEEIRREEVLRQQPIQTNTFRFEEEVKRDREVNFIMGLDQQQPVNVRQTDSSHHRAHQNTEEIYDIKKEQIERIDYFQPIPQPKVVFHEDREVVKDVSIQLGLDNLEAARPLTPIPIEKIQFEETRVIPAARDVSFVLGLDQPKPVPQRPVSVLSDSTVVTQQIVPQVRRFNEEIKKVETFEQIVEREPSPPPKRFHEETRKTERYEEIVEMRADVDVQPPPQRFHEETRKTEIYEEAREMRADVDIRPPVRPESPPSARLTAVTEIIPPLPRKVSLQTAVEATEIHHTEVEHVPAEEDGIFETSVAYRPHEKREHTEAEIQVTQPKPKPLPPTSGRVEKHVNLEKIIPEPTGQPLPQSLGTYGFLYTATIEPKRPELEQTIEFHNPEPTPIIEEVEEAQRIDWYVKPGRIPSLIPDDVSSIGEVRAATPPSHPELTATAQITPPTRLEAEVRVDSPPREFHFGDEEEDRLSVSSAHSEELKRKKTSPPPVSEKPVERHRNQLSKPVSAEAEGSHHTELKFSTPEEEEQWRTKMERRPVPRPNRAETSLHLEQPGVLQPKLPATSGRIPKKIWNEKLETENNGRPLPQSIGTYGFVYMTHVNPQTVIRGKPIEIFEAGVATVDLDFQQVILSTIAEIEPPLLPQQETQLLEATMKVFPPLTVHQQERLLHALVEIFPPLTPDQQRQLLTGSEEITPPLTIRQQQQLATISAEIIPPMTQKQQKELIYSTTTVKPPLTVEQQQHLLTCVTEIFPPQKVKKTDKLIEKFECTKHTQEEEERTLLVNRKEKTSPWERSQIDRDVTSSSKRPVVEKQFSLGGPRMNVEYERRTETVQEDQYDRISKTERNERNREELHVGRAGPEDFNRTEVRFSTPEEEERWKTRLHRQPVPRPDRAETSLQLESPEREESGRIPETSGRVPKKTQKVTFVPEKTGRPAPESIGTYGFIYMTHVNSQTPIRGKPIEVFEAGVASVDLDTNQLLQSAISKIHPRLSPQQETQLLEHGSRILPVLTTEQQERVLTSLSETSPPLTDQQQRQLLTGSDEVTPRLTRKQEQQLETLSTEIIPPLNQDQQVELLETTTLIRPPLTREQQTQFMTSVAEIFRIEKSERFIERIENMVVGSERTEVKFSTPEEVEYWRTRLDRQTVPRPDRSERTLELERPESGRPSTVPETSGRIPKKTQTVSFQPEKTGRPAPESLGTYGFIYMTHVNPQTPIRGKPLEVFAAGVASVDLDTIQLLQSAISKIQPPLSPQQATQLTEHGSHILPILTTEQQERVLKSLAKTSPPLTDEQQRQLLTGADEITPRLTKKQEQHLMVVSADAIPPLNMEHQVELLKSTTIVRPPLTREQQVQYMTSIAEIFQIQKSERLIEKLEHMVGDSGRTELRFSTPDEVEQWRTQLDRRAVPRPVRCETTLEVVSPEREELARLPETSGRFPKKTQKVTFQPETTGRPTPESLGTYGFVYMAHVNPQVPIRGKPLEVFEAGVATVILDTTEMIKSAISRVQPPLSPQQQTQLIERGARLLPILNSEQQQGVLNSLIEVFPALTTEQQLQLLSGHEEIIPPLTNRQEKDLVDISIEVIPPLSQEQQEKLLQSALTIQPPLTREQQIQFMTAIAEIFQIRKSERITEKLEDSVEFEEDEERTFVMRRKDRVSAWERSQIDTDIVSTSSHPAVVKQFPVGERRHGGKYMVESDYLEELRNLQQTDTRRTQTRESLDVGVFSYLSMIHVNPQTPIRGDLVELFESGVAFIDLEIQKLFRKVFTEIKPRLLPQQETQILEASLQVFPPLTIPQQERFLRALVQISPSLTLDQKRQLLTGSNEISPPLTPKQQQQLATLSAEIVPPMSQKQQRDFLNACTMLKVPLSHDQQNQILISVQNIFKKSTITTTDRIIEKFEHSNQTEEDDEMTLIAKRKKELGTWGRSQLDTEVTSSSAHRPVRKDFNLPKGSAFEKSEVVEESSQVDRRSESFLKKKLGHDLRAGWERHVNYGGTATSKDIELNEKKWLTEQRMDIEDEEQDLEVSAISMNVKPRARSHLYMDSSPPLRTSFSPSVGGFQYAASPQHGTPPMTEFSGFMYEATMDGHGSPMNPELGTYGFTYQATLDGSEPYRKLIEGSKTDLDIRTASFRTEESPKSMSVTPPWSTPPVTPTPVMGTSTPGTVTPLPALKELPEPSSSSAWKKPDQNVTTPWGRSWMNKDIKQDGTYSPVEYTLKTDETHRQELRGQIDSPEEEVHEKITETVSRRLKAGVESDAARDYFYGKQTPGGKVEIVTEKDTTEEVVKNYKKHTRKETTTSSGHSSRASSAMDEHQKTTTRPTSASPSRYHADPAQLERVNESLRKSDERTYNYLEQSVDQIHRNAQTVLTQPQFPTHSYTFAKDQNTRNEVYGDLLSPEEEVVEKITETVTRRRYEDQSPSRERVPIDHSKLQQTGENLRRPDQETMKTLDKAVEKIQMDAQTTLTEGRTSRKVTTTVDEQPDWVKQAEDRKKRQVPNLSFRPDKYAKKDVPRSLEVTKEEDALEALLERSSVSSKNKGSPEGSPSSLRKWGKEQVLSPAEKPKTQTSDESLSNKTYRRKTTETKNVIEESRFHSEQGLLDALNNSGSGEDESNLTSTMSQSLPSLAHMRRMDHEQLNQYCRENPDAVSMEELRKTSRTVTTQDGSERETRDVATSKRADMGPLETHRTKRIVVRKLVDGEWRDVAVHEEDVPVDDDHTLPPVVEHPTDRLLADLQRKDDDEWSLTDAVIEETTTTRTIRRVEEEEEDIISLASTDISSRLG